MNPLWQFLTLLVLQSIKCEQPRSSSDPSAPNDDSGCNGNDDHDESSRENRAKKYSAKQNLPQDWLYYLESMEEAEMQWDNSSTSQSADTVEMDTACNLFKDRANKDLAPFKTISEQMLEILADNVRHSVVYQVFAGKLYRSSNSSCLFPMRCLGVEHFLLNVAKDLEDTKFVVNYHDWPYMNKYIESEPLPLFSFSKTEDYYDIMYPAWSFWAGGPATDLHPTGLGRWDVQRDRLLASMSSKMPWKSKLKKAFFRGSRTSSERDNLVLLSRAQPEMVDAKFTKNQAWRSKADTLGEDPALEASLESHCSYRYLFNFRGVAASFRLRHLFLCKSLILHVGFEWQEFFYDALKPWIHYVPVPKGASISELSSILGFVSHFDDEVKRIAERGSKLIETKLTMTNVDCYWKYLLKEYTKKLSFKPQQMSTFVEVQPIKQSRQ